MTRVWVWAPQIILCRGQITECIFYFSFLCRPHIFSSIFWLQFFFLYNSLEDCCSLALKAGCSSDHTPPPSGPHRAATLHPNQQTNHVILGAELHVPCSSVKETDSHVDGNRSGHPLCCKKKKLRGKMHEEEDGSEAHSCTASRFVNSRSVDVADIEGAKEQASKLCGYLNKLSGKGPLRGYKPKWFVYDPRKCYLYYFKSPQDALPLGHIEICDACFSYDLDGEEGQFEIRTADKEFLLKVGTFLSFIKRVLTALQRGLLFMSFVTSFLVWKRQTRPSLLSFKENRFRLSCF